MHCIDLIAAHLPPCETPEAPVQGLCCVTGASGLTLPRKLAILPSFTNLDLLAAPGSDRVGLPAYQVLSYTEPNPGKARESAPLRQSHWIADADGLHYLGSKAAIRPYVLGAQEPASPWAGYVTTSYKKHGCLRAAVNGSGQHRWLFESMVVDCTDLDKVTHWWVELREAQDRGVPRPVIESVEPSPDLIRKVGMTHWQRFAMWAKPRRTDPLYLFLTYLLPSQEELKGGVS